MLMTTLQNYLEDRKESNIVQRNTAVLKQREKNNERRGRGRRKLKNEKLARLVRGGEKYQKGRL